MTDEPLGAGRVESVDDRNRAWNLKSFMDSLIVELDRAQDVLAVKGLTRPVTYTVKDVDVDLRCFPQFDGRSVRFRTAQPGQDGSSGLRFSLGSISAGTSGTRRRRRPIPTTSASTPSRISTRTPSRRSSRLASAADATSSGLRAGRRPQVGHRQQGAGLQRPCGDDHEGDAPATRAEDPRRLAVHLARRRPAGAPPRRREPVHQRRCRLPVCARRRPAAAARAAGRDASASTFRILRTPGGDGPRPVCPAHVGAAPRCSRSQYARTRRDGGPG